MSATPGSSPPGKARPSLAVRWRRWLWIFAGLLAAVGLTLELVGMLPRIERRLGPRGNPQSGEVAVDLAALAAAVHAFAGEFEKPPASWSELLASEHLETLPKDPWGRAYRYVPPAGGRPFLVYTLGSDGLPGGRGEDADLDHARLQGR